MSAIGILLAGGASSRFPAGKLEAHIPAALAELRGRPELAGLAVADAAYETLAAAVGRVIVLGEPKLSAPAECVADQRPGEGPAASLSDLLTGSHLAALSDETRVLILAADAPFAPPLLLGLMAAAQSSLVIAADEPLPIATSLGALRAAVALAPLPRLRDLAAALSAVPLDTRIVARLDPLGSALADIDTADDLAASAPDERASV
jgi:molybdopterin-guanine dinucleotide biosynthesis protein A